MPAVVVATDAFEALAVRAAHSQGLAGLRIVRVAHPIGGVGEQALRRRAEAAVDATLALLR